MALIYLVDDSPFQLKLYGNKLAERNYRVQTFERSAKVLAAIENEAPDLLVSDIIMPEMNGVELCQKIRENHVKDVLPILLMSSLNSMDDMVRGYEAGADDYLAKPVRLPEFLAKVALLLRQKRARESLAAKRLTGHAETMKRVDRYEILSVLGVGAYGTVYRACRLGCADQVALKVLSQAKLNKRTVARFLREAEMLKTLGEVRGIAQIQDVGYDGEHYFYAMDLIEGHSIRERLDKSGCLSEPFVLKVAKSMAYVLLKLSQAEIVHRDIKPDNIVIDHDNHAVLIDFGLARLEDGPTVTQRYEVPGTPAYIPPEAIRGDPVDSRSDLYSLGVTLFEALTNKLPFAGEGLKTLIAIADGQGADLSPLLDQKVSPGFSAVIEALLSKSPEDRYQNHNELLEELELLSKS